MVHNMHCIYMCIYVQSLDHGTIENIVTDAIPVYWWQFWNQASLEEWEIIGPSKAERAAHVISRIKVRPLSHLPGLKKRLIWFFQELLRSEGQCSNCTSWMMEAAEVFKNKLREIFIWRGEDVNRITRFWPKVRVTNTVNSLEVGSWRPSLGLALKVCFWVLVVASCCIKLSWQAWWNNFSNGVSMSYSPSHPSVSNQGRPSAACDWWVQRSGYHCWFPRIRPMDEVCQVCLIPNWHNAMYAMYEEDDYMKQFQKRQG